MEELLKAALVATEEQKRAALRVLRGEGPAAAGPRETEPFLTLKECGRRLGVSACSLWRWRVPGHELGGRPKFRMSEVEEYLESEEFKRHAADLREQDRARRGAGSQRSVAGGRGARGGSQ